ncbi:MAG: outer membrane beta-barrel protein [Bacteroidales bacterium]|nr:outer membrane beta-barrel protein [Bacteroidales bacterium]MBN2748085.1 outer membrane beta-barrel protein [Bacteroidales bacterium]
MNNTLTKIVLSATLLCIGITLYAQQSHINIFVVDEYNQPLDYFNFILSDPSDSTYQFGEVFYNGNLEYKINTSGHKLMAITSLGYKDYLLNLDFDNLSYPDTIVMHAATIQIGEVVVVSTREAIRIGKGKIILQIAGSSLANLADISSIMGRAPGVKASESELMVMGRGTPLIYIDDIQSTYSQLKVLEPANILSIEVDRNASARYEASAKAVVRVKTLRSAKGISGRFNAGVDVAHRVSPYTGGQLQINTPKLYTFLGLNYATPWYKTKSEFNQSIILPEYAMKDNSLTNSLEKRTNANLFYNSILNTSSRSKLSWQYSLDFRDANADQFVYETIDRAAMLTENISSSINSISTNPRHKFNVGYQMDFDSINKLEIFGDYSFVSRNKEQNIEQYNAENNNITIFKINNQNNADVASFRSEYTTLIANSSFMAGVNYGFINNRSKIESDGYLSKVNTTSHLFSLYSTFGNNYETWGYEVGLRYEYLNDKLVLSEDKVASRIENKLFPSIELYLNEPLDNLEISLNYAIKTTRPSLNNLNPSKSYMNKVTVWQGNPNLISTTDHNICLNFTMWERLSLDLDYNIALNSNLETGILSESKESITFTPVNISRANDFNVMLSYGNKWNIFSLSASSMLVVPNYKIPYMDGYYKNNIVSYYFRITPEFRISRNTYLNLNYDYGSKNSLLMAVGEPGYDLSINFSQFLYKRRVQIVASATDLFNKTNPPLRDKMGYYESYNNSNYDTRRFKLTIRYVFNNFKSQYKEYGESEQGSRVN